MSALTPTSSITASCRFPACYPYPMPRTTRRGISRTSPEMVEVIDAMRLCHGALVKVLTKSKIGGPAYKKASIATDSLLDLTEELTGERNKLLR